MRRNQSRSRARGTTEDEEVELALQRLVDKLRACQPLYREEDVAIIPFPGESTSTSPSRSPSRPGEEEPNANNDPLSLCGKTKDGGSTNPTQPKKSSQSQASGAGSAAMSSSSSGAVNLDQPLSAGLFLTAVNVLEPKAIGKSRRATLDAVKLIRQGYALVWRDPQYITDSANHYPSSAASLLPSSPSSSHAALPGLLPERRGSVGPDKWQLADQPATRSRSPAPTFTPDNAHVLLLDQAVQSLLVYANNSFFLSQYITSEEPVLRVLCFVCWAARRAEDEAAALQVEEEASEEDLGNAFYGGMRPPTGGEARDLERELSAVEAVWASCGLAGRVVGFLRECYLTEFLLDACLPPAVCSSRYDGVGGALFDKKRKILGDMVTSRHGFAEMMRAVPLRGLAGIAAMSSYADPKLKARLLDKMASEGLVSRLLDEMASACAALSGISSPSAIDGGAKSGGTGRVSPTRRSPAKRPRASQGDGASSLPEQEQEGPSAPMERERSPDTVDPVERLGYCVDLLQLLTSPNLRPASEADELAQNPKTAASAIVRATVWATHEKALIGVTAHLLWIICYPSGSRGHHPRLSSLQATATECVLHLAAYSGLLYGMVIDAVQSLFKGNLHEAAASPSAPRTPPPVSQSSAGGSGTAPVGAALAELSGLLPLIANLLRYTTHAQANSGSIRRWLRWLADSLLPQAFEAPRLTNGRRSSAAWGRRLRKELQQAEAESKASSVGRTPSKGRNGAAAGNERLEAPVLARDLTRGEVTSLSPYFTFAVKLVTETQWRDGAEPFLAKIALLAYHVVLTNARRCNLCFGQASTCYDVVAPLLLPVGGVIPGDTAVPASSPRRRQRREAEEGSARRGRRDSTGSADGSRSPASTSKAKRGRADMKEGEGEEESSGTEDGSEDEEDYQLFIPSPSHSPVFYEAYSPDASETTFIGDRSPSSSCLSSPSGSPTRRLEVDDVSGGHASGSTTAASEGGSGGSPQTTLTRSWRHSLKMLISSISGAEEAELRSEPATSVVSWEAQ